MHVSNEFWQHDTWNDFFNRKDAFWSEVNYFLQKYSELPKFSGMEYDQLYEEFFLNINLYFPKKYR